ncbi:MAG TPA: DUF2520 domain-containing protein [Myxococcales bacterium]|jgi:predicted short-subunit dehydrogenase-like oxidoreductase (DUF2520 family)|nr:DUF2520 domain-containing protein [Myxococcales bacterium]
MIRTAAVVGGGAVARALLEALPRAGIAVRASWRRHSGLLPPPLREVDVVFLAVSDAAVADVCSILEVGPGQLVAHLAGALGLAPLAPARRRGARVGSLHPLRAFAPGGPGDFRGAAAGIAGSDASARRDLADLANRLGMHPLQTRDAARALYHAAAVLAAGAQVALFSEAVRAFRKATGAQEDEARAALLPLALGALGNLRHLPPAQALTGPAARGDLATIRAHRAALPVDLLPLYDQLTRVALRLGESAATVEDVKRLPGAAPRGPAPTTRSSSPRRPPPRGARPSASSRSPARYGPPRGPPPRGPAPRRPR